jgi:5-methylcytosine-specific restriction endonuclease McrA
MSEPIPANLARYVAARAEGKCEYCRLPQRMQEATFHLDHVQPRADGGESTEDNLSIACVSSSLKKSTRTHALDPKTNKYVPLFHPRRDSWPDHFRWTRTWRLVGRTAIGRATIDALGPTNLFDGSACG